jgi:hypothetical protein
MDSWHVDVYHRLPANRTLETRLTEEAKKFGGVLDDREETRMGWVANNVCLTYEFFDEQEAYRAIDALKLIGGDDIHIEGPAPYG